MCVPESHDSVLYIGWVA